MTRLTRRRFLASAAATGAVTTLPKMAVPPPGRRVLTLVYDKTLGMMRAIDQVVR